MAGLADAHGRRTVRLVGHDWGGGVAWWAAARHPERVERLVAMNAPHPDAMGTAVRRHPVQALRSHYVAFFQLPRLPEATMRAGDFALLRRALTGSSRPGTFAPGDLDRYAEACWARPGALTAMLGWYRALRLPRPAGPPRRVWARTLVVWGTRDAFLERGVAEASLELCDDGRALFLDAATHWVRLEEAGAVNDAAGRFLEE